MSKLDGSPPPEWKSLRRPMFLIAFAIIFFLLLLRLDAVWSAVRWVLGSMSALFLGVAVAYVINLPMVFFEKSILKGWEMSHRPWQRKLRRPLSLLLSYLVVVVVLGGLIWMVLPKVVESMSQLAGNFTSYLNRFQTWVDGTLSSTRWDPDGLPFINQLWDETVSFLQNLLSAAVPAALSFTVSFTNGIFQFVLSTMLAGFMLYNKETLLGQFARLSRAVIGPRRTREIARVCTMANGIFGRFVMGQLISAIIMGGICFIGMRIFRMPYAILISTVMGITEMIPIVGPIVGTVLCAIILLMIEPVQAFWFVLFIIIIQQLQGNILYPRIVGNAIGLPGLWVLAGILIGGGLFGPWGLLLAVPISAVVYRLVGEWVRNREKKENKTT